MRAACGKALSMFFYSRNGKQFKQYVNVVLTISVWAVSCELQWIKVVGDGVSCLPYHLGVHLNNVFIDNALRYIRDE